MKKVNSKNILLIIAFVFLVNTAIALDLKPEIQVTFYEEVDSSTITINLTDGFGEFWDLELISSNNPTFIYSPVSDLPEGLYTVRAQARDLQGIIGPVIELSFPVVVPPLEIELLEPSLGVSSVSPFDFSIKTDRWAVCKYSFLDKPYDDMASTFDTEDNLEHKKEDFANTGIVYVKCKDEYDKISGKSFSLAFDDSPPDITYKYAEDVAEFPIETILIVRTNEKTVCRYYFEDSQINYNIMKPFPDYDENNEDSYKTEHQQLVDGSDLMDHKVNRCYLRCKNKAGLLSLMESIDIDVDTSAEPVITVDNPERHITDITPWFNVTTNKDAICSIADNSDMNNAISMAGTEREHTRELTTELSSGTYTYYVECIFSVEGAKQTSVTFSIDDTKPYMLYVNMLSPLENRTDKTYKDDELEVEWKAEDNESSVKLYHYYLYWDETDELIEEGTKSPESDNEYRISGLELNDSQKYYVKVSAQNGVGLWSDNMSSGSIEVDISLSPVSCSNNYRDGDETDIDCGGDCEGCANGKNCLLDSDCDSNFCNSSNKCAKPSCYDGVKNGGETDVDCGGNCKGCEVGDYCNENRDCKTNNCDTSTGKCAEVLDKCENGKLDIDETDVDCGGDCPGCDVGKNCDSDYDCITTAECKDGVCVLRQLDSDGDGIIDGKDNCPDTANEDQADVDGDGIGDECDLDSDNDGLPDSFEQQYFDCVTCAEPDDDPDRDGLTNLDEYTYNTNPTKGDTDGDGFSDKEEIDEGTDPLDPSSHPGGGFLKYLLMVLGLAVLGVGGYFGYKILMEKKKFVPPRAPVAKKAVKRPMVMPRRPMMLPIREMRPLRKPTAPITPPIRPAQVKPAKKPETIEKGFKIEKPKSAVKQREKKGERDIFKKLSEISKAERLGQTEKGMKSLKISDKELKGRIGKLKKELKV